MITVESTYVSDKLRWNFTEGYLYKVDEKRYPAVLYDDCCYSWSLDKVGDAEYIIYQHDEIAAKFVELDKKVTQKC